MKKEGVLVIFLVSILLFSNFATAYSFVGRAVDDTGIALSRGDKKVEKALEVREKEIDSAIENVKEGNVDEAIKNLERAKEKLEIVQEKASSNIADDVQVNVEEITEKIEQNKAIDPEFSSYFEEYLKEEEKTQLSAELSQTLFEYCEELATQDYDLMLQDEKCNPEDAPDWLGDGIDDKMEEGQEEAAEEMLEIFTTCISDPRECDCSEIPMASEKIKCEKGKALAIRCEFQNDESACRELNNLDLEMPNNLPKFLQPLFQQRINNVINSKEKEMFNDFAPRECVEAGAETREECEAIMMEKYAPSECVLAGATTKEECDKIMFSIHGAPPNECMENGEFIGQEACNEKMVDSGMIPKECIKDGMPISEEECRAIMEEKGMMGPPECKGLNKEECDEFFAEQGIIPGVMPPLIECEGLSEEECRIIMEEQGIVMAPPECEGLSEEECNRLIIERGLIPSGMTEPKIAPGKEFKIPQECVGMSFQECEDYLMGNYMPQECVEADALTPEDCKRIMLPQECINAGALTPEECGAIMINKGMPQECQDAGASSPEECAKLMSKNIMVGGTPGSEIDYLNQQGIGFDEIPDVCVNGSNFIRSMECDAALDLMGITLPPPKDISNIPQECIVNGVPLSPQECKTILKGKIINENIPETCREAGITEPEECGRLLNKERRNAGMGMQDLPSECYTMSVLECKIFMDEHGMEKVDVMGIMKRWGGKPPEQPPEKECEEGDVKTRDCGEGVEITECMCENGLWICADMVCPKFVVPPEQCNEGEIKNYICQDGTEVSWCECENEIWECVNSPELACPEPEQMVCCKTSRDTRQYLGERPTSTYKWINQDECPVENELVEIVSDEYCEEETPECEEGEQKMRDCGEGIEITDCICDEGTWACADIACPTFEPIVEVPIECAEIGIDDESACEIVMSKINEERIINGDQMIVDDEGNENYISNDEINNIVDEAEREVEEFEPDVEEANEIKEEMEDIEKEIEDIEIEQEKFEEPEVEESAPEPEQESAPEPSSEPEPEPESETPPATGEVVREIEPPDNFLTRFFDRIFG